MNAPMQTSAPDLSAFTKDALIELAKRIPTIHLGDYARKSKSDIRGFIEECEEQDIVTGYQACVDEGIFEEIDDEDQPAPVASPAKATKKEAAPVEQPAPIKQDAAAKLAEALKDLIPGAPVDMDAVRGVIASKIGEYSLAVDKRFLEVEEAIDAAVAEAAEEIAAKIEPRVEKVYIGTDKIERKIEGTAHALLDNVAKRAALRKANILLVGPAGCGKSHLAEQVAEALGLEFGSISCTAGMSESQLLGWLLPIGDGGKFEYVMSEFVRIYENGGVYLLDEVDALDGNTLLVLNQALANGGFYVPQARRFVKRHKDFVCIAAANTFGHGGDMVYAGRERLDGATLDRFRANVVTMAYDAKLEMQLIDAEVLAWGLEIRGQISQLKLRRVMSTRAMIDFTEQKQAYGWGRKEWEQSYFADWTRDELAKVGR